MLGTQSRRWRVCLRLDPDGRRVQLFGESPGGVYQNTELVYDERDKLRSATNRANLGDTLTATYSGLGHLLTSKLITRFVLGGQRVETIDSLSSDALGNMTKKLTKEIRVGTSETWDYGNRYQAGIGRLRADSSADVQDSTHYDAAGNIELVEGIPIWFRGKSFEDRASFYGADGLLRATDRRQYFPAEAVRGPRDDTFNEGDLPHRRCLERWSVSRSSHVLTKSQRHVVLLVQVIPLTGTRS